MYAYPSIIKYCEQDNNFDKEKPITLYYWNKVWLTRLSTYWSIIDEKGFNPCHPISINPLKFSFDTLRKTFTGSIAFLPKAQILLIKTICYKKQ